MDKRKCADCGGELSADHPGIGHSDRSICVVYLRNECDRAREEAASRLEARAKELEPLEGKPDMVVWKHGFLTGLAAMIREP